MKFDFPVPSSYPEQVLDHAYAIAKTPIFTFSELEKSVLRIFFTNTDRRVFFVNNVLPQAVGDVLLAMYSRMKNRRGLRGTFVDSFLPQFLAQNLPEVDEKYEGKVERFLKEEKITSLAGFIEYSSAARALFQEFMEAFACDPDYIQRFASSKKVKKFLSLWLDKYGHNSIARMAGSVWICFEKISILAAKSIEWTRPGSGYIELSTRYVDMSGEFYPIHEQLALYGFDPAPLLGVLEKGFHYYRTLQGESLNGPFPQFLRDSFSSLVSDAQQLENGVSGETWDVLGNFLPVATLTSVGVCVSGESYSQLLKHLLLDGTPENIALVQVILEEQDALGFDQFSRHFAPTSLETKTWQYSDTDFSSSSVSLWPDNDWVVATLSSAFERIPKYSFDAFLNDYEHAAQPPLRGSHDKLPDQFEAISGVYTGAMSFRGWRDLQRQGFCAHRRSYITPLVGFYQYDKPAPTEYHQAVSDIHAENVRVYSLVSSQPLLAQYLMAMGSMVLFSISGNLRQMEFCNWQRMGFNVNHEVRLVFMDIERALRVQYPWWHRISRADITPAYVFARTQNPIVLPK